MTTAALAAELGISEGNLWYHFKTKRDLFESISEEFVRYSNERLALRPSGEKDVVEGYIELMMAHERELLLYRFLLSRSGRLRRPQPDCVGQYHRSLR